MDLTCWDLASTLEAGTGRGGTLHHGHHTGVTGVDGALQGGLTGVDGALHHGHHAGLTGVDGALQGGTLHTGSNTAGIIGASLRGHGVIGIIRPGNGAAGIKAGQTGRRLAFSVG